MRERRRRFSAPLVAVTASYACSSPSKPDDISQYDKISVWGSACVYELEVSCPKNVPCNPPPPRPIECPAAMGESTEARIGPAKPGAVEADCLLFLPLCTTRSCGIPTPCLRDNYDPIEPLAWTITPGSDGRCIATPQPRTMFDGGGPVIPIACDGGVIERANPKAPCVVCDKSPCPINSRAVACPELKP